MLRHEPQEADEKSIFAGKNYTMHSELASKVANAKLHGAAAILLVNDLPNHPGDDDRWIPSPRRWAPKITACLSCRSP